MAPFEHVGAARSLMHLLKYRGVTHLAGIAAELLAGRIPPLPLVPVPRTLSRRIKYGIDPALLIARQLSKRTGQPVIRALSAPLYTRRRAGGDHHRSPPVFRLRRHPPDRVVVIDDVVTTGATILSAVAALGADKVEMAAAANVVT
ncbi:MAG TPA: hypothetical protein VE569_05755 [Acidimicrobiia bacterium]|nr:hypothetical protein [Acidimicrobiia bacterium]